MRGLKIAGLALVAIPVLLLLALWSVLGTQAGSRWALGQVPGLSVENFQGRLGGQWSADEEEAFKAPIRAQYEVQGNPYYATARLWDDGIIDPADTRRVLALGLAAAAHAPIPEPRFGVFRM